MGDEMFIRDGLANVREALQGAARHALENPDEMTEAERGLDDLHGAVTELATVVAVLARRPTPSVGALLAGSLRRWADRIEGGR